MKKVIILLLLFNIISNTFTETELINRTVLLMPCYNINNIVEYDYLTSIIRDVLRAKLDKSQIFNFIDFDKINNLIINYSYKNEDYIDNLKSLKLALNLGADIIVTSKFSIIGENIIIIANAYDVLSGETMVISSVNGKVGVEIYDYVEKSTDILAEKMSKSFQRISKTTLEDLLLNKYGIQESDQKTTKTLEISYEGAGLIPKKYNNIFIVAGIVPKSPAEKAHIEPGDKILEVNGENVSSLTESQFISKVRGTAGTDILFKIQKYYNLEQMEIKLTRESISREIIILQESTNKNPQAVAVLNFIRFFQGDKQPPAFKDREYKTYFKKNETKYVFCEIGLLNNPYDYPITLDISSNWTPSIGPVYSNKSSLQIKNNSKNYVFWGGHGYDIAGKLVSGKYIVDIFLREKKIATGYFFIVN